LEHNTAPMKVNSIMTSRVGGSTTAQALQARQAVARAGEMRDHRRVLPDPGCYEERYRLTAGAAPTLGVSLFMIGLLFRAEAPWAAGAVIAVALAILLVPAVAARRRVAFRADYAGLTFGSAPGALMLRRGQQVFIPWGEVDTIVLHPDDSGVAGRSGRVGRVEVRRRDQAGGMTREVSGWRLDRERLASVIAAVAPGIAVVEGGPGVEGPPRT
jgi:hypothetical protein